MCMIYKAGKPGAYVRACYRTGHAGAHIPYSTAVWSVGGHHLMLGAGQGRSPKTTSGERVVCFRTGPAEQTDIEDMARYAGANRLQVERDGVVTYILLYTKRGISTNARARARSFSWSEIRPDQLPAHVRPEFVEVAAVKRARRAGQPETWWLNIMAPEDTPNEALLAWARTQEPTREPHIYPVRGFTRGEVEFVPKKNLDLWRDSGWTRGELGAVALMVESRGWWIARRDDWPSSIEE